MNIALCRPSCKQLARIVPFFLLALLTACGGGSGPSPIPATTTTPPTNGATGTITLSISSTTVSANAPVTLSALVVDAKGAPIPNQIVSFSAEAAMATFNPAAGTVLTDTRGVARIQMSAASITASGAGLVTATANVAGTDVVQTTAFQIGSSNVTLGSMLITTPSISAYATTSVSVPVYINGSAASTPTAVQFSSPCTSSGKASIDSPVTSVNGLATATYTAKGCAGSDIITASVNATSTTGTVTVAAPTAASLLSSAVMSPADGIIALKGFGSSTRPEVAQVNFQVVDSAGHGIVGKTVNFSLSTQVGGILFANGTTAATATTDANGDVSVLVHSGNQPTPVRIIASVPTDGLVSQSNGLSISTGIPSQSSFSLSSPAYNLPGLYFDGVQYTLNVRMSDHFNNPIPDGTPVTFLSNGGQIGNGQTGSCTTVDSTCSITLTSQNPRPANGRIQILAYAIGEQSFTDLDGTVFADSTADLVDVNGNSTDIGEAFLDNNEDGVYTPGVDTFIDYNGNGVYDGPDGLYKGSLCKPGWAGCSTHKTINVFGHATMILSDSAARLGFVDTTNAHAAVSSLPIACNGSSAGQVSLYARDLANGNILPKDSTISFSLTGPATADFEIVGPSTFHVPAGNPKIGVKAGGQTLFTVQVGIAAGATCLHGDTAALLATVTAPAASGAGDVITTQTLPVIGQ